MTRKLIEEIKNAKLSKRLHRKKEIVLNFAKKKFRRYMDQRKLKGKDIGLFVYEWFLIVITKMTSIWQRYTDFKTISSAAIFLSADLRSFISLIKL